MTNAQILRLPAVVAMLGVSKPTIYVWIKKGIFPAPLKLGPQSRGWRLSEIEKWIADRETARGGR